MSTNISTSSWEYDGQDYEPEDILVGYNGRVTGSSAEYGEEATKLAKQYINGDVNIYNLFRYAPIDAWLDIAWQIGRATNRRFGQLDVKELGWVKWLEVEKTVRRPTTPEVSKPRGVESED